MYVQLAFALDEVKAMAPDHPEWKDTEPFKSVLAGDIKGVAASGKKGARRDHRRDPCRHDDRQISRRR